MNRINKIKRIKQIIYDFKLTRINIIFFVLKNLKFMLYCKNIIVHNKTNIRGIKNIDTSNGRLTIGMGYIGFLNKNDKAFLNINGKLIIKGKVQLANGVRLDIAKGSICILDNCRISSFTKLIIQHSLEIGKGTIISWDCELLDEDFHKLIINGNSFNLKDRGIKIGEHVWIGSDSRIYKGVKIGNNSVISAGSRVFQKIPKNSLVMGNPAKVIFKNVNWE
jgi:acetyltransferase-like isoleucine patch superfamily enzyme